MDRNDNELEKLVPFLESLVELVCGFHLLLRFSLSLCLSFSVFRDLNISRLLQNEDVRPHIRKRFRLHNLLPPD